jgi:predicted nucleic acid-binding protein
VRVLLDTTVLIDILRGRPAGDRLMDLRRNGDQPSTTAINVEEVARGLRPRERSAASRLIAGLEILPLGSPAGSRAGVWRQEHAGHGITLSQADCLIAAAAFEAGAQLATGNPRDFPMAGLSVDHWPVGE